QPVFARCAAERRRSSPAPVRASRPASPASRPARARHPREYRQPWPCPPGTGAQSRTAQQTGRSQRTHPVADERDDGDQRDQVGEPAQRQRHVVRQLRNPASTAATAVHAPGAHAAPPETRAPCAMRAISRLASHARYSVADSAYACACASIVWNPFCAAWSPRSDRRRISSTTAAIWKQSADPAIRSSAAKKSACCSEVIAQNIPATLVGVGVKVATTSTGALTAHHPCAARAR